MIQFEEWPSIPLPSPWERTNNLYDHELSILVREVFAHRDQILVHYPLVKLPSGYRRISTPLAALILAWERWNYLQGDCPDCGSPALGVCFGGMLSKGQVTGVCTKCAILVKRFIGGGGRAASGAQKCLEGTPFSFRSRKAMWYSWHFQGIPSALVAVLKKLGVTDLPRPTVSRSPQTSYR